MAKAPTRSEQPDEDRRSTVGKRRGLILVIAFIALVGAGWVALQSTAPSGPGEIDTTDPTRISALVEDGILPPGLPEGARVRAVWRGEEPAVEVWFHVSGAGAEAFRAFRDRIRSFNGNLAALGRLGTPPWWDSFSEPAQRVGVILRRDGGTAFVVWRVETDRLLRIRGRRMVASARGLGLVE
ncbi:MAG: hypothetical protein AAF371_08565 [Pseudomonadota bacterium]